jgi:hypothetical protein
MQFRSLAGETHGHRLCMVAGMQQHEKTILVSPCRKTSPGERRKTIKFSITIRGSIEMKRILSIVMVAALALTGTMSMCFAGDEDGGTVANTSGKTNVKAVITDAMDTTQSVNFDISETITITGTVGETKATVSDLIIKNKMDAGKTLSITQAKATGKGSWEIATAEEVAAATVGDTKLSLSFGKLALTTEDQDVSDATISGGTTKHFELTGSIAEQETAMTIGQVATLVVTITPNAADASEQDA